MAAKGELVRLAGSVAKPLKYLGPIGSLASLASSGLEIRDSIREIYDYKKEIKKLEVEERRIDQEAAVRHHQIDAAERIAMEELEQRSQSVREMITLATADLARTRIDRRKTVGEITRMSKVIASPGTSTEDRKVALAALVELRKIQAEQMQQAQTAFEKVVNVKTQHRINHRT